jgi:hypothetical protein
MTFLYPAGLVSNDVASGLCAPQLRHATTGEKRCKVKIAEAERQREVVSTDNSLVLKTTWRRGREEKQRLGDGQTRGWEAEGDQQLLALEVVVVRNDLFVI